MANENLTKRIDSIDTRLIRIEEMYVKIDKQTALDVLSLKNLITQAVVEGNKEILNVINTMKDEYEERISCLENAEAKKALEQKKFIAKTIIGCIISVLVTFFATLLYITK